MIEWIIGIDPGLMTGMALVEREGRDVALVVESLEVKPEGIAPKLREWLALAGPHRRVTVVCEAYLISNETAKKSQQAWSLEHIGLVKQVMRDYNMDLEKQFVLQKPAVKPIVDNEKLKRVGMWHVAGKGHANDALRHCVVRLINVGWRDSRLLAPPSEE